MTTDSRLALRLSQAARALGIETVEVARLVHERRIRYVMVEGIGHIPPEALEDVRGSG